VLKQGTGTTTPAGRFTFHGPPVVSSEKTTLPAVSAAQDRAE
jgi:hypothetical protein